MDENPSASLAIGEQITYGQRCWEANARSLAWIILTGTLLCHFFIFWIARTNIAKGSYDFVAFYAAAQIVDSGHGDQLYQIETQRVFQERFSAFQEHPLLFNHPPFEVLMYLPLAFFSFPTAFILWTVVSLGALCAALALLFPYLRNIRASLGAGIVVMLGVAFYPVLIALMQGQDSLIFFLLYVLTFVHLQRGNDGRAGFFASLGMFRYQLMLPLLLALGFQKRWKVLSGLLPGVAGLGLATIFATGWQGPLKNLELLLRINRAARSNPSDKGIFYIHPEAMANLRGFLDTHLGGKIPDIYIVLLLVACSLLLLAWALNKGMGRRVQDPKEMELPFALYTIVILLVSYHMHLHDVSLLLVPLLLASNHLAQIPASWPRSRFALLLLVIVMFFSPTYIVPFLYGNLNLLAIAFVAFALLVAAQIPSKKKLMVDAVSTASQLRGDDGLYRERGTHK